MAATGRDVKTQELNFILEFLGKEREESQRWWEFFWKMMRAFSELISKRCENRIMFRPYGSAVEYLNCQEPDNAGDVDVMIFPTSDNLIIQEELIEYLPENPLHVRIKGADHPVLQSCLVENTEYVATPALKNFHPAIYGRFAYVFPSLLQLMAKGKFSSTFPLTSFYLKNSRASPAATLNFATLIQSADSFQFQGETIHEISEISDPLDDKSNGKQREVSRKNQNEKKGQAHCLSQLEPIAKTRTDNPELLKQIPKLSSGHLSDHKTVTETTGELSKQSKVNQSESAQLYPREGGIDCVPAFRSRGWPKVAKEWIERERKWPSPDMVDRIIQEGFHLVVKSPKTGGNPDRDFRISFSHAEYLLSQEMNDIQRECYRCLEKYHRAYLSTEPKGLVSFHLKNILLQTIEETGVELWTESNRAECMMKLLGNLFEALKGKDLRHFFVRSYNLFSVDYIEDPEILVSLAGKVEQIMKHPQKIAKEALQSQNSEDTTQAKTEKWIASSEQTLSTAKRSIRQPFVNEPLTNARAKGSDYESEQTETAQHPSNLITSYRYDELKDIFLASSKRLIDMAFNHHDFEDVDTLERSLVEDLKEIERKTNIQVEEFPEMFDASWFIVYHKVCLSTEENMRRRVFDGIQSVVAMWKYMLKQHDFAPGNEEAVVTRMIFDSTPENPLDFGLRIPAGVRMKIIRRVCCDLGPDIFG